jgi:hypothetical protein
MTKKKMERKSVRRIDTSEVHAEGSFVVVSGLKVKEIRALRKLSDSEDYDSFESGLQILRDHIVEWNWVDDDGEPLANPKDNPDVLDELTSGEVEYLSNVMIGQDANSKN